ncbi:MAG: DUF433 domain-containing protein [Candidatus Zixiibacteriota bacterium]
MSQVMIRETGVAITEVLELIAAGHSYKQVLEKYPQLSLGDIMLSARVAKDLVEKIIIVDKEIKVEGAMKFTVKGGQFRSVDEMKKDHARAFEKWTEHELEEVVRLHKGGRNISEISRQLQRSYGSIKARLERLGLIDQSGRAIVQTPNKAPDAGR